MYGEHFKLNEPPFRLSPDPQFLYASRQHARARAYMDSIMSSRSARMDSSTRDTFFAGRRNTGSPR